MVQLVEGDVVGEVDGDGVDVKQEDEDGEVWWWRREMRVRWEWLRDREMRWVWWHWERARIQQCMCGRFLRSELPSGVVGACPGSVLMVGPVCFLKIPQHRTCFKWGLEDGGRNDDSSLIPRLLPRSSFGTRL